MPALLAAATVLWSACAPASRPAGDARPSQTAGHVHVQVVSHRWHTGFVVPADFIRQDAPDLAKRFPKARYFEFGWGDRKFYPAGSITVWLTIQAMFWPTPSVVHVVGLPVEAAEYQLYGRSKILDVEMTPAECAILRRHILSSFQRDGGRLQPVGPGLYGDSTFYEAEGRYHLCNSCNNWTLEGLRKAGFAVRAGWVIPAKTVLQRVQNEPQHRVTVVQWPDYRDDHN